MADEKALSLAGKPATAMGTPCAKAWDPEWIDAVNETEKRLGRPVCGARSLSLVPCTLTAINPNGRCHFHGGGRGVGGQKENRQGLFHGLYSRRLMVCGPHCAVWEGCPYANDEVRALKEAERPVCVYEKAQYESFMGGEEREDADCDFDIDDELSEKDAEVLEDKHLRVLMGIMLTRASAAVARNGMTEETVAESDKYQLRVSRMSPHFNALMRLSAEYRRYKALQSSEKKAPVEEEKPMSYVDEMQLLLAKTEGVLEECLIPTPTGPAAMKTDYSDCIDVDDDEYE